MSERQYECCIRHRHLATSHLPYVLRTKVVPFRGVHIALTPSNPFRSNEAEISNLYRFILRFTL